VDSKKFQEIVYGKKGSEAIDTRRRYLMDFFTLGANNYLLLSRFFRHDFKAFLAEGVKAWQDLRLVVPGKANGASQLLVHTFSQRLALGALTGSRFLGHFFRVFLEEFRKRRGESPREFSQYGATPLPIKVARGSR
jgi:hypothetical protein